MKQRCYNKSVLTRDGINRDVGLLKGYINLLGVLVFDIY